jgi:hypothetical protein
MTDEADCLLLHTGHSAISFIALDRWGKSDPGCRCMLPEFQKAAIQASSKQINSIIHLKQSRASQQQILSFTSFIQLTRWHSQSEH